MRLDGTRPGAELDESPRGLWELQDVLGCLSGKWVPVVLATLSHGPKRNFQLRQAAPGISAKVLSDVLRRLIRDGLITQVLHIDSAGHTGVGYQLTELGSAGIGLLVNIQAWASAHVSEIEKSRDATCELEVS